MWAEDKVRLQILDAGGSLGRGEERRGEGKRGEEMRGTASRRWKKEKERVGGSRAECAGGCVESSFQFG
jgi:hypothetical protein